jgi:hypothetical protein
MTDYLAIARECGADVRAVIDDDNAEFTVAEFTEAALSAFAERVRQDERERCAAICRKRQKDVLAAQSLREGDPSDVHLRMIAFIGCEQDADAILAPPDPGAPA